MREEEIRRLQRDLDDAIEGKKFIEDEVQGLRLLFINIIIRIYSFINIFINANKSNIFKLDNK